ncbi:CehA/McbA family metallohydrolase, partial [bacterium]|nr:CehA/McbA family metallohydrolase [bacterium]
LNQGARLVATAGTDTHRAEDYATKPAFNVVYAEELSEEAILKALRAGHLYLSCGPKIAFEAQGAAGQKWIMGDTVTRPAMFRIAWDDCEEGARICLISHGVPLKQWTAYTGGEHIWEMHPGESDWVLIEIRDAKNHMLAITNPIFLDRGSDLA